MNVRLVSSDTLVTLEDHGGIILVDCSERSVLLAFPDPRVVQGMDVIVKRVDASRNDLTRIFHIPNAPSDYKYDWAGGHVVAHGDTWYDLTPIMRDAAGKEFSMRNI